MDMDAARSSGLLSLPAELRTTIYEYLYEPDQRKEAVDLLNVVPPSNDLLLVCKMIHHEANVLYKECFRNFWSSNSFVLDCRNIPAHELQRYLRVAREDDISQITMLVIYGKSLSGHQVYTLIHPQGGWRVVKTWGIGSNELSFRRYKPWIKYKSPSEPSVVDPTRVAYDTYSDEEEMKEACEKYSRRPPPLKVHILDLLGMAITTR